MVHEIERLHRTESTALANVAGAGTDTAAVFTSQRLLPAELDSRAHDADSRLDI